MINELTERSDDDAWELLSSHKNPNVGIKLDGIHGETSYRPA